MGTTIVNGKNVKQFYSGSQQLTKSVTYNRSFNERDTTNMSTPGDATETRLGRFNGTVTMEHDLTLPWGNVITSGTLVSGSKYRVESGVISGSGYNYEIGEIFIATGSITATPTNSVKAVPRLLDAFNPIALFDAAEFVVLSGTYSKNYSTVDKTNNKTTGRGTELEAGRATAQATLTLLMYAEDLGYFTETPAAKPLTIIFESGSNVSVSGMAYVTAVNDPININEMVKQEYTFKFDGLVTETNLTFAKYGQDVNIKTIFDEGDTSDRHYETKMLTTGISVSFDAKEGSASCTINGNIQGTVTETVKS